MAKVKYSRLPMGDSEDSLTFDYSSAFTYGDSSHSSKNYQSAFTYSNIKETPTPKSQTSDEASSQSDIFIRYVVLFGYSIVYLLTFPVMVWFSFKKVPPNKRLVVFRLGKLHKAKGPGIVHVFPILDTCHAVDVTLRAFSVPPKQVITADRGIIEVGADIFFQVKEAEKSVTYVQNLDQSTRILLQASLCNILVTKPLSEIEAERRAIADYLLVNSNKVCVNWGVEISRVELSQIKVLSEPQPSSNPTLMMPPGLFMPETGDGAAPSPMQNVFAHIASALTSSNKASDQAQALAQALPDMMQGFVNASQTPETGGDSHQAIVDIGEAVPHAGGATGSQVAPASITLHTPLSDFGAPASGAASSGQLTPVEILSSIQSALCSALVQKIKSTYQFEITGEGGGTYYLDLMNGDGYIGPGPDPSGDPDAILTLTFEDLQAMLADNLQPFHAYMSGRLRVSGDVSAAVKLEELGKRMRSQATTKNV